MNSQMKVTIDDEVVHDGKALLIAVANGHTYGGGYHCAPEAKINDGLIDVCLAKKISRFQASGLMSLYKNGKHVNNPKFKDVLIYKKCKKVTIESPKPVAYAIDGETFRDPKIEISILPLSLNFVVPTKLESK